MPKPRLWRKDDRLVHRTLNTLEAIVLEFRKDSHCASGYYCHIQESTTRESYGDWGMIREDWQLKKTGRPGRNTHHLSIRVPGELMEEIDQRADEEGRDRTSVVLDALYKEFKE